MKRRPYPKYKESGLGWAGEIPAHWAVANLRRFATMRTGHTPSRMEASYWQDCDIPWFTLADVWQLRDGKQIYLGETKERISLIGLANSAAELLPTGTVVLSRTASVGFSGIMPEPMCTTQDFWNWIPGPELLSEYLLFAFRAMSQEFQKITMGSTHKTIYQPDAARLELCVPPVSEQTSIVRYIKAETTRIDTLVEKNRTLIERLKEKRTALISRTVIRGLPPEDARAAGLDPHPKLRPSGVEWLGDVPEHWTVKSLARVTISRCDGPFGSGLKTENYTSEGTRVVRLNNIRFARFDAADAAFVSDEYALELGDHSVLPGDLLIAGLGDDSHPVGRACVAPLGLGPAMVKADCFRFRLKGKDALAAFVAYQLSTAAAALAGALATGTTRARMNLTETARRPLALPEIDEQRSIIEFIDRETMKIDQMITRAESAIERLQEYRSALITAAVTGKIDVRDTGVNA
jgi:type I restriction enzyme S subunit